MKIQKQARGENIRLGTHGHHGRTFAKRHGCVIRFSAIVKEFILPFRFVNLEVLDESHLLLIPTNDENGYKLSINQNGAATIAWCHAQHFFFIPEKERIPIVLNDDGSLILDVSSNCRERSGANET